MRARKQGTWKDYEIIRSRLQLQSQQARSIGVELLNLELEGVHLVLLHSTLELVSLRRMNICEPPGDELHQTHTQKNNLFETLAIFVKCYNFSGVAGFPGSDLWATGGVLSDTQNH